MSTTQQPEALRLAELCDNFQKLEKIGTELRRQHARIAELEDAADIAIERIAELEAQLSAIAHTAEGATAQTGAYAEARECEHCNHVGINDSAEGVATCVACQWIGDSPKEDKCPDCEAEGTMTASCPKCHHEYRLIADATLADPHPTQQGLEQFIEQVGDVHFQRCRIGSKEGAIRWDIELGHYGAEVRGKTLREAITKAIAAQAKKGKQ